MRPLWRTDMIADPVSQISHLPCACAQNGPLRSCGCVTIQQSNCGMDGSPRMGLSLVSDLPRVWKTRGIFISGGRVRTRRQTFAIVDAQPLSRPQLRCDRPVVLIA